MHPNRKHAFVANSNAAKVEVNDIQSFEIDSKKGTSRVPDRSLLNNKIALFFNQILTYFS